MTRPRNGGALNSAGWRRQNPGKPVRRPETSFSPFLSLHSGLNHCQCGNVWMRPAIFSYSGVWESELLLSSSSCLLCLRASSRSTKSPGNLFRDAQNQHSSEIKRSADVTNPSLTYQGELRRPLTPEAVVSRGGNGAAAWTLLLEHILTIRHPYSSMSM